MAKKRDDFNFEDLNRFLGEFIKANQEANSSFSGYLNNLRNSVKSKRDFNIQIRLEKKLTEEINTLLDKKAKNGDKLSKADAERLKILKATLKAEEQNTEEIRNQLAAHEQANSATNLMLGTVTSIGKGLKYGAKILLDQKAYLLDGLKAVRATEKGMGVLRSQSEGFRANLYKTALITSDLGLDVKDLAKIQTSYSESLGTNVLLGEKQLNGIAEIIAGTGMSLEAASKLAGEMATFGVNAETASNYVDDITKTSRKMGVNTTVMLDKLHGSLKMANKYHFQGGVKGMAQMAMNAAKFKVEMESIGGLADKLFDPEGAIEMAGQLQVLGGAWSQIADPMQLLFKARNDMAGLQKDVIKAASGVAKFNKETGEFEISALELHRMKSAAEMTGISMDELAESAKKVAEVGKIKTQIRGVVDKDTREFIANTAKIGKDGKATIQIKGDEVNVKDLGKHTTELKAMMKDNESLKDRTKMAQTFDEKLNNLILKAKSGLLPIMEKIDNILGPALQSFTDWLNKPENMKSLVSGIKKITDGIQTAVDWFTTGIQKSPLATLATALAGGGLVAAMGGLFEYAKWYSNGVALSAGFNTASMLGGGGSGMGGSSPIGGGRFMKGSPKNLKMMKGLKGGGIAGIAGLAGGLATDAGLFGKEGSTGHKIGGVASSALSWGGTGAMIGSMIAPGIGTAIGAALGGIGGALMGAYDEGLIGGGPQTVNDGIAKPGRGPFSITDKFGKTAVTHSKDGIAVSPNVNKTAGTTVVTFDKPLEIKGEIKLTGTSGQIGEIDLNNPILIRELTRIIQEQLSKNYGGGKLSSNPI